MTSRNLGQYRRKVPVEKVNTLAICKEQKNATHPHRMSNQEKDKFLDITEATIERDIGRV